jgi:hypothetical protein
MTFGGFAVGASLLAPEIARHKEIFISSLQPRGGAAIGKPP